MGTLVFDARIGLLDDTPSEEAMKFIQGVDDFFKFTQTLLFGFFEKHLLPYIDTPSFKKLSKSMDAINETGAMFVNKKVKELEEMASGEKNHNSQENEGEIFLSDLL